MPDGAPPRPARAQASQPSSVSATRWSTTAFSAASSLAACLRAPPRRRRAGGRRSCPPRRSCAGAPPRRGSRAASASSATSAISSSTRSANGTALAAAEIDQLAAHAVALRQPAVLRDQRRQVLPPAQVAALQRDQHLHDRLEGGGERDAVVHPRADVGDAHLQRRKARRGAKVPPDLGGVLDAAELHQEVDHAAVFAGAGEGLRQAGARQLDRRSEER